jgi:hypothetical protein
LDPSFVRCIGYESWAMAEPTQEAQTTRLERAGQLFGFVLLALLAAGIVFAIIGIYPHKVPTGKNPSFIDNIFDSRIVILAMRIVLLFAAAYVAVSVVGLIASRRWIAELGPFKASEPLARLERGAEALEKDLADAVETIETLEQRLEDSDEALASARSDIADLLDHIDTMEGPKEGK